MDKLAKNLDIKTTLKATRQRRTNLVLKVYCLKLDKSHLSQAKLKHLNLLFAEAKWLYNYMISLETNLWDFDYKQKQITSLDKDGNKIDRDISALSSQIRQAFVEQVKTNIRSLVGLKKAGKVVGRFKFKSEVNSIPLNQSGVTYKLKRNRLSIQGFKGSFRIEGTKQLKDVIEFANAKIVRRCGEFYLHVTCYEAPTKRESTNEIVGLDFGISSTITTSDNENINMKIPETQRLKRLSRGLARKVKRSASYFKQKAKREKEYQHINNQKKDKRNKIVSYLTKRYDRIFTQDESVKGWHSGLFGRQVQMSAMGGIIADLKKKSATSVVDKWFPSTQLCECCGKMNKHSLDKRTYTCGCGHSEPRDFHAAKNILSEGLSSAWRIRNSKTPAELNPLLDSNIMQGLALTQEAAAL